jgi:lysozyme
MNISPKGLDLIKKWEGCELEAYLDPVGIPTIGYGTIAYPDGREVAMGDRITKEQADGFLMHECASFCARVEELVTVPLNQNQFDALVSFAYNVGGGALGGSTLLRKLNQSDYAGAASEFLQWNKGKVNGQMVEISGLTNRRKDEKAVFESSQAGGQPVQIDTSPTPQQQVTWLEGYADNGKTVIVGWNDSKIVEIISLESKAKRLLIDVLNQYPKAANFVFAPPGNAIPAGERITITDRKAAVSSTAASVSVPPVPSQVLARGSNGEDVKILQERLKDLGYYKGDIDGDFGSGTDAAVRMFQADAFGRAEADGRVGRITWGKLWESTPPTPISTPPGVPGKTYLRLTKTDRRDGNGLCILMLDYIKNGTTQESLQVCSGAASAQRFRTGALSRAQSMEPLPEGRWKINDILWAAGKDDYGPAIFQSGLGPVTTPIDYAGPGSTERGAIEIHIDWNKSGAPGTAGCIGINTVNDYKTLVRWLRDSDPRDLYVDWKLGTCPQP